MQYPSRHKKDLMSRRTLLIASWLLVVTESAALTGEVLSPTALKGELELLIMRHAQSVDNVFPRQGPFAVIDPALSDAGKAQAAEAGENLASVSKVDLVLCSCLLRAQETALLVFASQSVVYAVPHICEETMQGFKWLPSWLIGLADKWQPRAKQQVALRQEVGEATAARLSYAWTPTQAECGPADWSEFLSWLWAREEVQDILKRKLTADARPRIAVVSHGNFLKQVLGEHGWDHGQLNNAEVFSAVLPIRIPAGKLLHGFGDLRVTGIIFHGFSSNDAAIALKWVAIIVGVAVIIWLTWRCRRGRSKQRICTNAQGSGVECTLGGEYQTGLCGQTRIS